MPTDEFDFNYCRRLSDATTHWWVRGMEEIARTLLDEEHDASPILDAGCGSGESLRSLTERTARRRVTGIDVATSGLIACRDLRLPVDLLQASVTSLPFRSNSYGLVVSLDVLQHLTEDEAVMTLAEVARVLRSDGRVLVRTNAAFGRSRVQERSEWRLYRRQTLREQLVGAGFDVEVLTYVNSLPSLWSSLPLPRRRPSHGHGEQRAEWGTAGLGIPVSSQTRKDRLLLGVLRAEARWLAGGRRRLPFGHSLYALARRR